MSELRDYEQRLVASQRELESAETEAARINANLNSIRRRTDALEQIVRGLRALAADEPQAERLPIDDGGTATIRATPGGYEGDPPRGREAVRIVMHESPTRTWKQADVVDEIKRRGWVDKNARQPDAAIRLAVRRLASDGEIEKVPGAQGLYRLKVSDATASDGQAARAAGEPTVSTGLLGGDGGAAAL